MKTRTVVLASVMGIVACGGNESRPANEPSIAAPMATTASTMTPPSDNTNSWNTNSTTSTSTTSMGTTGATAPGSNTTTGAPRKTVTAPSTTGSDRQQDTTTTQTPPPPTTTPANTPAAPSNPDANARKPDNTGVNTRDRGGSSLTPVDQSNSPSDIKISAAIRQAVVGDNSLSFTAKNVKIITVNGKVTLRGPVKSDQEKATIEARAKQTTGVTEVDNQLEVKK